MPPMKAANHIRSLIQSGKQYVIKDPVMEVKQMLRHGCKKALYFKAGDVMFVIEDDAIVTCHTATADRWKPKERQ